MGGLLRISEAAVLAVHTVALLGAHRGESITTRDIAFALDASEAHLSKVLQQLGKRGVVSSVRGPKGGFALSEGAEELTLLDVYEAMDGPLCETLCLLDAPVCEGRCVMGGLLRDVRGMVRGYLAGSKISDVSAKCSFRLPGVREERKGREGVPELGVKGRGTES